MLSGCSSHLHEGLAIDAVHVGDNTDAARYVDRVAVGPVGPLQTVTDVDRQSDRVKWVVHSQGEDGELVTAEA